MASFVCDKITDSTARKKNRAHCTPTPLLPTLELPPPLNHSISPFPHSPLLLVSILLNCCIAVLLYLPLSCSVEMASAISTSASPEQAPAAAIVFKEFRCTVGTCTKSFSRAEHLHRHALNHDEERANNTCLRCSAVFKRRDLLGEHQW